MAEPLQGWIDKPPMDESSEALEKAECPAPKDIQAPAVLEQTSCENAINVEIILQSFDPTAVTHLYMGSTWCCARGCDLLTSFKLKRCASRFSALMLCLQVDGHRDTFVPESWSKSRALRICCHPGVTEEPGF
eukprot:1145627-Pelagomonas_calceolata.AAC.2